MGRGTSGNRLPPRRVMKKNSSRTAGTFMPAYSRRQCGSSVSRGPGSRTAPEFECAPTLAPFSRTHTFLSGASCFKRMAAARPAGPAPTITTSYSITSVMAASFGLHADRAVEADSLAVQHGNLKDGRHQARELLGLAEACGEGDLLGERLLLLL